MNKIIKINSIIIIIISLMIAHVSYAVSNKEVEKKNSFMELSDKEISVGETVSITFNLASIENKNFTIQLSSNISLDKIFADNGSNVNLEYDETDVNITINKSELDLDKITVYYTITDSFKVGDTVEFNSKVVIDESTVLEEKQTLKIIEKSTENQEENIEENNEEKQVDNQESKTNKKEYKVEEKQNTENKETQTVEVKSEETKNTKSSSVVGNNSQTQTAIYNGSNNNYLSNLEVEGVELNTTFNKENTTYFVTVSNTNSINVVTTKDDNAASVCITGNDSITESNNKVLITVTAENGNVRYYRIFVTIKEA